MSLRTLLVAAALSGAAIAQAYAADQSVPSGLGIPSYYPNAYYPTSIRWTGFYAGLNLGGAWSSAHWIDPFSGLGDSPQAGFVLGGAQIGANWQWDSLVFGIEANFDWTGLEGTAKDANGFTHTVSTNWLSTVTGRLGYAMNQLLVYGKGGLAVTNESNQITIPPGVFTPNGALQVDAVGTTLTAQSVAVGWTFGAGIEYAFDPHWSARFEYDYVEFPAHSFSLAGVSSAIAGKSYPIRSDASTDLSMQVFTAALNYRF
jgi:outer membrane immunogenic protein